MAVNKYISIKICGNPDSNSGFAPLLLFNNPSFAIEDQAYVGFDNCSYFFSLKVDPTQTIYKLIKNNVRSYGAARDGSLEIAFSLPKGYKIDNGYSPYDVLTQLKDEFLRLCMTCKDAATETYEFNAGRIDQHVLDEKAKLFSISPATLPHRVMNPSGNIGYIMRSEKDIRMLFKDISYPEFQNYKEIIIADSVNNSNYLPIQNIQIPRQKAYTIIVDGATQPKKYSDISEVIPVQSGRYDDPCFEHKTVSFSIKDLMDGRSIDGVSLDNVEEQIRVNTKQWAKPKKRTLSVRIVPQEYEKEIHRLLCIYDHKGQNISLDDQFSFTLQGEQIKWVNQIRPVLKPNNKFELIGSPIISGDEIQLTINKKPPIIQPSIATGNNQRKTPSDVVQGRTQMPIVDIKLLFEESLLGNFSKNNEITVDLYFYDNYSEEKMSSNKVSFKKVKQQNSYEGHLCIPEEYIKKSRNYYIVFENRKMKVSSNTIKPQGGECVITDRDITKKRKSFWIRNHKTLIISAMLLLMFIIGSVMGYSCHDAISNIISKDSTERDSTIYIPTPPYQEGSATGINVDEFFEDAEEKLESEDLTFNTVNSLYEKSLKISPDSVLNDEQNNTKSKISDYFIVIEALKRSENADSITKVIDLLTSSTYDKYELSSKHADLIKKLDAKKFNEIAKATSFADLKNFKQETQGTSSQSKSGTSATSATTSPTEKSQTLINCRKSGCNEKFISTEKMLNHCKTTHHACLNCLKKGKWLELPNNDELDRHINARHLSR